MELSGVAVESIRLPPVTRLSQPYWFLLVNSTWDPQQATISWQPKVSRFEKTQRGWDNRETDSDNPTVGTNWIGKNTIAGTKFSRPKNRREEGIYKKKRAGLPMKLVLSEVQLWLCGSFKSCLQTVLQMAFSEHFMQLKVVSNTICALLHP